MVDEETTASAAVQALTDQRAALAEERTRLEAQSRQVRESAASSLLRGDWRAALTRLSGERLIADDVTARMAVLDEAIAGVDVQLAEARVRLATARRASATGRLVELDAARADLLEQAVTLGEGLAEVVGRLGELDREFLALVDAGATGSRLGTVALDGRGVQAVTARAAGCLNLFRYGDRLGEKHARQEAAERAAARQHWQATVRAAEERRRKQAEEEAYLASLPPSVRDEALDRQALAEHERRLSRRAEEDRRAHEAEVAHERRIERVEARSAEHERTHRADRERRARESLEAERAGERAGRERERNATLEPPTPRT